MNDKSDLWKTIDGKYVALSDVTDTHLRGIWALCRRKIRSPKTNKSLLRYSKKWLKGAEKEMEKRAEIAAGIFYANRKPRKPSKTEQYLSNAWEKGGFDDSFFDDLL